MVSDHGCIRVVKQALALKARGHWVEILSRQEPFAFNRFDRVTLWHDADQLMRSVRDSRADVVHVHNEPDWLVSAVRQGTSRPVIFDIHDLNSLRLQALPNAEEVAAFADADGYVHVSEPCKAAAESAHPAHVGKPSTVLPCYVNAEFYPETVPRSSPDCLVYEGGLSGGDEDVIPGTVLMRDYRPWVEAAVKAGFHVGLCSAAPMEGFPYANLGAVRWGPLPYPAMLRSLRPYGWGMVGAVPDMPLMQAAMPNKLFEYLSQGVIPVVYHADTASAFCAAQGFGVTLESLEEMQTLLRDQDFSAQRDRVLSERWAWTMERHIHQIETLYNQVLDQKSRIRGVPIAHAVDDDLGVPV